MWFRRTEWRLSYVTRCPRHRLPLVDACPDCGAALPATARGGSHRRRLQWQAEGDARELTPDLSDPSRCAHCGLRWENWYAVQPDSAGDAWWPYQQALIEAGDLVGENAPPWHRFGCTFAWQFLAGVRVLLAILRSPRTGEQLRNQIALLAGTCPEALTGGGRRAAPFESYSAMQRCAALDAVAAMLSTGMLGLTSVWADCGITWSVLLQIEVYVPFWLAAPVRLELDRSRYSFSEEEIAGARRAAAQAMRLGGAKGEGPDSLRPLTKVAMARLTGTRDSAALDRELGRRRRRYGRQEAVSFFCRAIAAVPRVPRSRTQRLVVLRTVLLMLAVAVSGRRVEDVCSSPTLDDTVRTAIGTLPVTLRVAAERMLHEQGYGNISALSGLLRSRFGEPLKGASTRLVAARLLKTLGSPHIWNSIDALAATLLTPD